MFFKNQHEKPKIKAKFKNRTEFMNWMIKLQNIALNTFEWEGLPDTVDVNLMEWSALWYGKFCFVEDAYGNILSLPTADGGNLNVYGYPINAWAYGFNGTNFQFKPFLRGSKIVEENLADCNGVICYDNALRYPYIAYILDTAERLSDNIRTIDVVVRAFKSPYFLQCNPTQFPTLNKLMSDITNNEPSIITADALSQADFQVLNTGIKAEILTALWDNYNNTFDVFKETFGIQNNQQSDKKERLITAEVTSNNASVDLNIEGRLKQRETFCDIINAKWGLNVSVKVNEKNGEDGGFDENLLPEDGRFGDESDNETAH